MPVTPDMREWLESQRNHFEKLIATVQNRRMRAIVRIRDRAISVKKHNKKAREYKKILTGITDMLNEENWEA
jgi:hypothetical protein